MRVLVVTTWYPTPDAPGTGIFNLRDVEMLAEEHDVRVLHLGGPVQSVGKSERLNGAPVTRVPFNFSNIVTFRGAVAAIRAEMVAADIVHTMAIPALLPVLLARSPARRETPWVHTEHWSGMVNQEPSLQERIGKALLGRLLRKPDRVVAVGSGLARAIRQYRTDEVAVIGNHVRLVENGVLPQNFADRGDEPLRMIGVGGLVPWKGPLEAVETVAMLRDRGISAELRWAGVGQLERDLVERAEQLRLGNQVKLLGHLEPAELSRELSRAHLFLLPTCGETFGIALAEALGHGLPIVTSGTGGHEDFLPRLASRIVPSRNPTELANAIQEMFEDPDLWPPAKILEYARKTFSDEERRIQYRAIYASAQAVEGHST